MLSRPGSILCVLLIAAAGACRSSASDDTEGAAPARTPRPLQPWQVPDAAAPDTFVEAGVAERLDRLAPPYAAPAPVTRKHRHGDCKTAYAPRPDRDPNPMCRVTGGTFQMGGPLPAELKPLFSSHPVPVATTVGDFDIDQLEVTAQQAALFVNAHGNHCPGLRGETTDTTSPCVYVGTLFDLEHRDGRYVVKPGRELAAAELSWEGALRYCAWVGKQVPSSAQWEYAARHDPRTGRDLVYPWGDEWKRDHAGCHYEGTCSRITTAQEKYVVGLYDGTRGFADGSSPWGVHDAAGGVDELVFECAAPDETCRAGSPCACRGVASTGGQSVPLAHATFARLIPSDITRVRCAVPRR